MTAPRRLFHAAARSPQAGGLGLAPGVRFDDGLRKVLGGTITYDELLRVAEPPAPLED